MDEKNKKLLCLILVILLFSALSFVIFLGLSWSANKFGLFACYGAIVAASMLLEKVREGSVREIWFHLLITPYIIVAGVFACAVPFLLLLKFLGWGGGGLAEYIENFDGIKGWEFSPLFLLLSGYLFYRGGMREKEYGKYFLIAGLAIGLAFYFRTSAT